MALSQAQHTLRGNKDWCCMDEIVAKCRNIEAVCGSVQNCVESQVHVLLLIVGSQSPLKNSGSHIDASHSRQPLVKGERLVRYEVNAVMLLLELLASVQGCTNRMW